MGERADGNNNKSVRSYLLNTDGTPLQWCNEDVVAITRSAILLRRESHVLKIPNLISCEAQDEQEQWETQYRNDGNQDEIEIEKDVYQRMGKCDGIARCIRISDAGILLQLYTNGDLEDYISQKPELGSAKKAEWILSLIRTEVCFHEAKVLVFDTALRNILVADDLSLKMIDFGQCKVLPLDADVNHVDIDGLSAKVDIFQLGNIIYSIAVWKKYEYCYFGEGLRWPSQDELPDLEGVLGRTIIDKCWARSYSSMRELFRDAQQELGEITERPTAYQT
ncbi:hypothetical protein ACLMJK_007612 [Lecanora helva]